MKYVYENFYFNNIALITKTKFASWVNLIHGHSLKPLNTFISQGNFSCLKINDFFAVWIQKKAF